LVENHVGTQQADDLVAAHWSMMAQAAPSMYSWTDSPTVMSHIHRALSGDPTVGWLEYVCRKYLLGNGRGVERGLSLGCGSGALERQVRRYGACEVIDAYDIAPGAVEEAQKIAEHEGVTGIHYAVANLNDLALRQNHYDAVFASMAVHHLSKLEGLFASVAESMRPGGVFIMLEYMGATQFQFSDKAVQIINDVLAILPPTLRERSSQPGQHVARFESPTIEHMNALDPSEAIRSAEILPLLADRFAIVEKRDFGGTLNHMLLQDIVHNFEDGSPERAAVLKLLLYLEMLLIQEGVIESDFSLVVARPLPRSTQGS
jgi:SAM-dependent methyltransferase